MSTPALPKLSAITGKRVVAGLLSWKSDATVESTLADHQARGLFGLFDDFVIHFQETRDVDIARAERFGLRWIGSDRNRHIGGGFLYILDHVEADYYFLLEDDLTLAVSAEELSATLQEAIGLMEAGRMDQFLCRRHDMTRSGYEKYFPVTELDTRHGLAAAGLKLDLTWLSRWYRRVRHPRQAEKHLRKVVWFESHPEKIRPDVVTRWSCPRNDFYVVSGPAAMWANPGLLASRTHLREVYGQAQRQIPGFADFGPCLEAPLNEGVLRPWWLGRRYRVGYTKPVLTVHSRHSDGGKLAFGAAGDPDPYGGRR